VGLVRLRGKAVLREGWRTLVLMAVVVGLGGAAALTSFAGARRTDSAMSQFVAYSLPDDGGFLSGSLGSPPVAQGRPTSSLEPDPVAQRVLALPQVVSFLRAPYLFITTDRHGAGASHLTVIGALDAAYMRTVDRPLVLSGTLPSPGDPTAAVVNAYAAEARGLHVGSTVHLYSYSSAQAHLGSVTGDPGLSSEAPSGPSFTMHVTTVVRSPQEVDAVRSLADRQGVPYESQQTLYVTPAFVQRYAAGLGIPVEQISNANLFALRLRHGSADWPAFARAAKAVGGGSIFLSEGNAFGVHQAAASAQRGIHVVVLALIAFGAIVALMTLVLVGQAISRQVAADADDDVAMRALGADTRQAVGLATLRAAVAGLAGGALAVVVAVLASPLMPIGLARQAEVHPGFSFDTPILLPGALALAVLLVPWAAVPAWRRSRRPVASAAAPEAELGAESIAAVLARTGAPAPAHIGLRFGIERDGARSGALTAAFAAIVAIAAVAASLTFGNSLVHLESAPRQQGWNWDVLVGNPNTFVDEESRYTRLLAHDRFVSGYSAIAILAGASQGNAFLDGKVVNLLLAFDPLKGSVYPPLLQGHAPRANDEIVLASKTLSSLHKRPGQWVEAGGPSGQPIRLRIVGTMISPSVGDLFTNGMGEGGWVYGPAVRAAIQEQQQSAPGGDSQSSTPPTVFTLFAVRFAPGTSTSAAISTLRRQFGPVVLRQLPAQDVVNLQSVNRLPLLVALLVVVLGVATIGNTLVGAVRRHRRDIALLKTIGFLRRQVAGTVAWQATAFSAVSLVVGLPIGVALGRWAWTLTASSMGSTSPPLVPALAVALVVPAALLAANGIAAGPGWTAARVAPALAMRAE
jgi:hypothetical protein